VTEAYKANNDAGYVFTLSTKGYGGEIRLICGINSDGTINAVKTLLHSETSGIGSKVVDNASGYSENYCGKTADNYSEVDAVTGATISSKAYKKAIGTAFEAYDIAKEAK
jgi:electron transport complex protein RnfG